MTGQRGEWYHIVVAAVTNSCESRSASSGCFMTRSVVEEMIMIEQLL